MTSDFTIRSADRTDISFLERCACSAYAQYVEAIGKEPAPMAFNFGEMLGEIPIEVMMSGGEAVGYLVWYLREDDLFLESIAIAPKKQGLGLARKTMNYLEKKARAAGRAAIVLYTNERMTANLTLYPHLGFVEIARKREHEFNRVYFRKGLQ